MSDHSIAFSHICGSPFSLRHSLVQKQGNNSKWRKVLLVFHSGNLKGASLVQGWTSSACFLKGLITGSEQKIAEAARLSSVLA